MKALTLVRPMGWAIVHKFKPFENRSKNILPVAMRGVRSRIAIHNGAKWDAGYDELAQKLTGFVPSALPMAVVGLATLTGRVYTLTDPPPRDAPGRAWFFGPFGLELDLAESVALETPVPCKGALGFWNLPADVERQVMEQLR